MNFSPVHDAQLLLHLHLFFRCHTATYYAIVTVERWATYIYEIDLPTNIDSYRVWNILPMY